MHIIGLAGFAGTGKDTVADMLLDQYSGYRRAFADPLRSAAQAIFGLTLEQMTDRTLKETPVPYWNNQTPRQLLQRLGTEAVRDLFGADTWCKRAALELEAVREMANAEPVEPELLVFTDVRFADEADWISKQGGVVVNITRAGVGPVNDHASDAGLPSYMVDFYLPNNGDLEQLRDKVARHSVDWISHCNELSNQSNYARERACVCAVR